MLNDGRHVCRGDAAISVHIEDQVVRCVGAYEHRVDHGIDVALVDDTVVIDVAD